MMMGPDPMIRTVLMSFLLGMSLGLELVDQLAEIVEQVLGIVGTGRGFGVILDAEDGQALMTEAFERFVDIEARQLLRLFGHAIHHEGAIAGEVHEAVAGDPLQVRFWRIIGSDLDQSGAVGIHEIQFVAGEEGDLVCVAGRRRHGRRDLRYSERDGWQGDGRVGWGIGGRVSDQASR